jgi:hypothetical protein
LKPNNTDREKKYRQYDNKIEGVWLSNKFCISTQNGLCIEKTVGQIRENSGQRRVWFSVFFQIILCEFVISFFSQVVFDAIWDRKS